MGRRKEEIIVNLKLKAGLDTYMRSNKPYDFRDYVKQNPDKYDTSVLVHV